MIMQMIKRSLIWLAGVGLLLGASRGAAATAPTEIVLDQTCALRQYYRFDLNRYSAELLKSEGDKVLGRTALEREKRATERWMQPHGLDPARMDWREHVYLTMAGGARAFTPVATPAPAADWMMPDFDDQAWVRKRGPFQWGAEMTITKPELGQFDASMDLRLQQAFYRVRFLVTDPAQATGLSLDVVYTGGVGVFLNGKEIARGHLPAGTLAADSPATPYPAAAYQSEGESLRQRKLEGIAIAPENLRPGVNVLAIENRASHFHPVVMTFPIQPNWGGPTRPWPHARLHSVQLRGASAVVPSALTRPAEMQVYVEDVHHRTQSSDFLAPGESHGTVRIVGTPGGSFSAQIVIGTDAELLRPQVTPGPLCRVGGNEELPASALTVRSLAPYPARRFTLEEIGDERGLGAKFPSMSQLAALEATDIASQPCLFDHLTPEWPTRIPAHAAQPVWITCRIPTDATAGTYRGQITVNATGKTEVRLPVEIEVAAWTLPAPREFKTFVGCEQNPYGVAAQYGVTPWSDAHFSLLAASFHELGRIGSRWLNVPVLRNTEFGNRDDSMVRWTRKSDGTYSFDFAVLDRYLDLAIQQCGNPKVVNFVVMHGMPPRAQGNVDVTPEVMCFDERTGQTKPLALGGSGLSATEKLARWGAFAQAAFAHMKSRGLTEAMWWGYPLEGEADPELKDMLARATPQVFWMAGPHEMMANGTFAKQEQYYHLVADIRYHGGWPSFRDDTGWQSKTIHLNNPRAGGTCIALHTVSLPLGYRLLADRCLAMGRSGFTRVGADEWAGVHYQGMTIPRWLTGMPVLFTLWPGKAGAEPSVRFEMMLEGVQEAEARIFIEQRLDRGSVSGDLAARAKKVLADNFNETTFLQGNCIVQSFYENSYRWQERSRHLYQMAAEVAKAVP
jgi:hypothetical protein